MNITSSPSGETEEGTTQHQKESQKSPRKNNRKNPGVGGGGEEDHPIRRKRKYNKRKTSPRMASSPPASSLDTVTSSPMTSSTSSPPSSDGPNRGGNKKRKFSSSQDDLFPCQDESPPRPTQQQIIPEMVESSTSHHHHHQHHQPPHPHNMMYPDHHHHALHGGYPQPPSLHHPTQQTPTYVNNNNNNNSSSNMYNNFPGHQVMNPQGPGYHHQSVLPSPPNLQHIQQHQQQQQPQQLHPMGKSSSSSLPVCFGCHKPISERFLLKAMDELWHEDCLKCSCCDCRLGEVGSTLYTRSNLILCKRDYLRLFGSTGICSACRKTIPAFEMVMRAKTNNYHLECFACQRCDHRFCVGDKFYLFDNLVLCEYDYEDVMRMPPANVPMTHQPQNGQRSPAGPTQPTNGHSTTVGANWCTSLEKMKRQTESIKTEVAN